MDTAETPIFSGTATPYHGKQSNGVHPESLRSGLRDVELKQSPTTLGNRISDSYERMKRQFGAEVESRRSAIGGIDQMWLLMSQVTDFNPVCASSYTLKGKLTREKLRPIMELQAESFPRYRQRLADTGRKLHGARFEDSPDFDVDQHIRTIHLPGAAGKKELDAAMSRFLSEDWDLAKPLWDVLLVDNYTDDEGAESAMITRGHHTLADGQGFVLSQLWCTSYRPEIEKLMNGNAELIKQAARGQARPSELDKRLKSLDPLATNGITAIFVQALMAVLFWLAQFFGLIEGLLWTVMHLFHAARMYLWVSWRTEFVTGGYRGARVAGREASTSRAFPIADVKTIQKAFSGLPPGSLATKLNHGKSKTANKIWHVTLNDVVCACMTDVLADEMSTVKPARGLIPQFVHSFNGWFRPPVGFFIPISLRQPGVWDMRNLSTGALVYLNPQKSPAAKPTSPDLYAHIHRAKKELTVVKKSLLPQISFNFLQMLISQTPIMFPTPGALLPGPFRRQVVEPIFAGAMSSFPAILTNVPGPAKKRVSLAGVEIIKWTALPPQGGKGTIGIGVISYAGGIHVSIAADDVRETRGVAQRICRKFEKRFETYLEVAKQVLADFDAEEDRKKLIK